MSESTLYGNGGTVRTSSFNQRNQEDADELRALKSQQRDSDLIGNAREQGFREGFADFEQRLASSNQFSQVQPQQDLLSSAEGFDDNSPVPQSALVSGDQEQAGLAELKSILNNQPQF